MVLFAAKGNEILCVAVDLCVEQNFTAAEGEIYS